MTMSSPFDESPRATKRRRSTPRYSSRRTTLLENEAEDVIQQGEDAASSVNGVNLHSTSPTTSVAHGKDTRKPTRRTRERQPPDEEKQRTTSNHAGAAARQLNDAEEDIALQRRSPNGNTEEETGINGPGPQDSLQDGETGQDTVQENTPQRLSGRQRKPPKRLVEPDLEQTPTKKSKSRINGKSTATDDIQPASPMLKGILTPSRKQKGGKRKSVMFDQDEKDIEEQFGFRDVGTPAVKKLSRKSTPFPKRTASLEIEPEDMVVADNDILDHENPGNNEDDATLADEILPEVVMPDLPGNLPAEDIGVDEDTPEIQYIKSSLLSRLTGTSPPVSYPDHLEVQYNTLHNLLKATITASESNSLLLLGPRGAGKSMLLDIAIKELAQHHDNDFHTVRLNGFLQTDDRLALREIWRQLGHSRAIDESETEDIGASYADTMASLLSLLSHPDEMMTFDPSASNNGDVESLAQDAVVVAEGGKRTTKSIIFVLDEFDLFTTHPRQTLLYNLFDIAQSRKAPIAVVGCSSRMDVIECLEKRVKSRFSHRWLLVSPCKNLAEWETEVKRAVLFVNTDGQGLKRTREIQKEAERWNAAIQETFMPSKDVQHLIKSHFYATKSLPDLFMALYPSIAALQLPAASSSKSPSTATASSTTQVSSNPSILATLPTLPILHLSLLVSMARLETIHSLATSNFNLVYTHYTELVQTSRLKQTAHGAVTHSGSLRQWGREACRGAWEELGLWGMTVPVVGGTRDEDGGFVGGAELEETRMWRSEVTLEDLVWGLRQKCDLDKERGSGAAEVLGKWCREV